MKAAVDFNKLRTWVEVDLGAIKHNFRAVRAKMPAQTSIMAVIKADAYGHGALPVAKALAGKADSFGVATFCEALELRNGNITEPILILGYTSPELSGELVRYNVMPTIFTEESAAALSAAAVAAGYGYNGDKSNNKVTELFIAIDTGMSRIGFPDDDFGISAIKRISEMPAIKIRGIFTHLARADECDKRSAGLQQGRFASFCDCLAEKVDIPVRSLYNSAAIADFDLDLALDLVREGIILYGLKPSGDVNLAPLELKPALSLKSRVVHVKVLPCGVGVSYGHTYVTSRETAVATVAAGYADGVPRLLSNRGRVLIRGQYAPIIGRVCMDQLMVDVTEIAGVCRDDEVTIIGSDGNLSITADDVADLAGTIGYEIVCAIPRRRVPRIYLN